MRLSECVFILQEMAAASREHMRTMPIEEETAKTMLVNTLALEMAAEKLDSMLPKNERLENAKKGAN